MRKIDIDTIDRRIVSGLQADARLTRTQAPVQANIVLGQTLELMIFRERLNDQLGQDRVAVDKDNPGFKLLLQLEVRIACGIKALDEEEVRWLDPTAFYLSLHERLIAPCDFLLASEAPSSNHANLPHCPRSWKSTPGFAAALGAAAPDRPPGGWVAAASESFL